MGPPSAKSIGSPLMGRSLLFPDMLFYSGYRYHIQIKLFCYFFKIGKRAMVPFFLFVSRLFQWILKLK
ncbi:MAG: hypothetical protein DRP87_15385 [Spirochaetes bacterium]|nr:MAG: hypothetical protein DRP87_15385 [Spirochaetota bacterium]